METIKIKRLSEDALLPVRATEGAACFDLYVPKETPIKVGRNTIHLDIAVELPSGTYAEIRPRSGFTAKGIEDYHGCRRDADVQHGIVDEDYRGNVGVTIKSNDYFVLAKGTRIAQMLICRYLPCEFVENGELSLTARQGNGFGWTGTK